MSGSIARGLVLASVVTSSACRDEQLLALPEVPGAATVILARWDRPEPQCAAIDLRAFAPPASWASVAEPIAAAAGTELTALFYTGTPAELGLAGERGRAAMRRGRGAGDVAPSVRSDLLRRGERGRVVRLVGPR